MQLPTESTINPLSLKELAELLVKHNGLTEGFYETSFEFRIGVGGMGPTPEEVSPGAMFAVTKVGLNKVSALNHNAVDAAEVNPTKKPRSKKAEA
jgi:hypothetical protein